MYVRRAENFRFPKADEDASTPPGVNGLKTQRGVSYETGVQWDWKRFINNIGIYQLYLKDEIQFDPTQTPEDPFGTNRNLDPTIRRGAFITEKVAINDYLTINGQYNFVNARFQSGIYAGKRIPLVSENIVRAGANIKFAEYWNFYAEGLFTGNQYADNDNANIAPQIGGYTIFNLSLRYVFKNFTASLRCNNVFDKNYFLYTVYQPSMQSEFFYPAPVRNFLLSVKYSFL
jgi:iron complex outermembrane receptor protein